MRLYSFLLIVVFCSCQESEQQRKKRLITEWSGREIAFPAYILSLAGEDTVDYKIPNSDFLVVTYADSSSCSAFRKQVPGWKRLMSKIDSLDTGSVSFVFFFEPSDVNEMLYTFHKEKFTHPVCFDFEGKLEALNRFPEGDYFRSFLLDRERRVMVMGNPVLDGHIEELYTKLMTNFHFSNQ